MSVIEHCFKWMGVQDNYEQTKSWKINKVLPKKKEYNKLSSQTNKTQNTSFSLNGKVIRNKVIEQEMGLFISLWNWFCEVPTSPSPDLGLGKNGRRFPPLQLLLDYSLIFFPDKDLFEDTAIVLSSLGIVLMVTTKSRKEDWGPELMRTGVYYRKAFLFHFGKKCTHSFRSKRRYLESLDRLIILMPNCQTNALYFFTFF